VIYLSTWDANDEFEGFKRIPVILNILLNEDKTIVCMRDEALDCFLRTRMDVLVIGPFVVTRT